MEKQLLTRSLYFLPVKRMGCLATTYGAIFFLLEMVFNLTVIY